MEHIISVFWILAVSVCVLKGQDVADVTQDHTCPTSSQYPCKKVDLIDFRGRTRPLYLYSYEKDLVLKVLENCQVDAGMCIMRKLLNGNVKVEMAAVLFTKSTIVLITEEEIHVILTEGLCESPSADMKNIVPLCNKSLSTLSVPATCTPCSCPADSLATFFDKTTTTASVTTTWNTHEVKPETLRQTEAKTFKAADIVISCVISFFGGVVSVIIVIYSRHVLRKRLLTKSPEDHMYAVEMNMNKAEKEKQTYEMLNKPSCSDGFNSGDHVYLGMNDDQSKNKHTDKLDMKARGSLEATPGRGRFDEYTDSSRVSPDEHMYAAIKSSQCTVIPKASTDEEPDYEANKDHSYVILEKETEGAGFVLETNDTFTEDTGDYQSAEDRSYFTLQKAE